MQWTKSLKNRKEQQLFSETRNGNIRSSGKLSNPKTEEGYCNWATQSGPLTHSQSHQAQNTVEHTEVKESRAWTKEEIRDVIWCYMYCRQHFTENDKEMYEMWRKRNPE
jgi:glucose dehydrogenase